MELEKLSDIMAQIALDELKVAVLNENKKTVTLNELRGSKAMVLDFWHTKCVKCPAALERLNDEAGEAEGKVLFVACALSQGQGNLEAVEDLTMDWENLTHVFMEVDMKELAKKAFGFTQVPFYVVVGESGSILGMGDPKNIDYEQLLAEETNVKAELPDTATAPAKTLEDNEARPAENRENVFTLDEDF